MTHRYKKTINNPTTLEILHIVAQATYNKKIYLYGGAALKYVYGWERETKDIDLQAEEKFNTAELCEALERYQFVKHIERFQPEETFEYIEVVTSEDRFKIDIKTFIYRELPYFTAKINSALGNFSIKCYTPKTIFSTKICAYYLRDIKQIEEVYRDLKQEQKVDLLEQKHKKDLTDIKLFVGNETKIDLEYLQIRGLPFKTE